MAKKIDVLSGFITNDPSLLKTTDEQVSPPVTYHGNDRQVWLRERREKGKPVPTPQAEAAIRRNRLAKQDLGPRNHQLGHTTIDRNGVRIRIVDLSTEAGLQYAEHKIAQANPAEPDLKLLDFWHVQGAVVYAPPSVDARDKIAEVKGKARGSHQQAGEKARPVGGINSTEEVFDFLPDEQREKLRPLANRIAAAGFFYKVHLDPQKAQGYPDYLQGGTPEDPTTQNFDVTIYPRLGRLSKAAAGAGKIGVASSLNLSGHDRNQAGHKEYTNVDNTIQMAADHKLPEVYLFRDISDPFYRRHAPAYALNVAPDQIEADMPGRGVFASTNVIEIGIGPDGGPCATSVRGGVFTPATLPIVLGLPEERISIDPKYTSPKYPISNWPAEDLKILEEIYQRHFPDPGLPPEEQQSGLQATNTAIKRLLYFSSLGAPAAKKRKAVFPDER